MRDLGSKAVATIGDLIKNGSEKTRLEAARLVVENIEKNPRSGSLHPEDIESALAAKIAMKPLLNCGLTDKKLAEFVRSWVLSDSIGDPFDGVDDEDDDEDGADEDGVDEDEAA